MKKLIYLIVAMVVLGLIASGCFLSVVPPTEKDEITSLTKAKPLKPPSGAHYNLNIIGKKSDWNAQGSFDNPDRHTMFVPQDTTGWTIATPGDDDTSAVPDLPGIKISMTQGDEFAVLDGMPLTMGNVPSNLLPENTRYG